MFLCEWVQQYTCLTALLLKQGYQCQTLHKEVSKFYCSHSELIAKYNVGLIILLKQGISKLVFYGDLVYEYSQEMPQSQITDQPLASLGRDIITQIYKKIHITARIQLQ